MKIFRVKEPSALGVRNFQNNRTGGFRVFAENLIQRTISSRYSKYFKEPSGFMKDSAVISRYLIFNKQFENHDYIYNNGVFLFCFDNHGYINTGYQKNS
jgi:hypothetical protein